MTRNQRAFANIEYHFGRESLQYLTLLRYLNDTADYLNKNSVNSFLDSLRVNEAMGYYYREYHQSESYDISGNKIYHYVSSGSKLFFSFSYHFKNLGLYQTSRYINMPNDNIVNFFDMYGEPLSWASTSNNLAYLSFSPFHKTIQSKLIFNRSHGLDPFDSGDYWSGLSDAELHVSLYDNHVVYPFGEFFIIPFVDTEEKEDILIYEDKDNPENNVYKTFYHFIQRGLSYIYFKPNPDFDKSYLDDLEDDLISKKYTPGKSPVKCCLLECFKK